MSAKFWATVPDRIGRIIRRAADHDGSKHAAKAGSLLEEIVRLKVSKGEFPEEWGDEVVNESKDDDPVRVVLKKALSGESLTPAEEARAAMELDVEPHKLHTLLTKEKNGNEQPTTAS